MMRYAILAGAMLATAPAMAQDAPAAPQQANPAPTTPAPAPEPAMPAPADQAAPVAQPAPAAPQSTADKVAQVVEAQFPTYDADANGSLSKAEFGTWMASLRANDPAAKPGSAELKKWTEQAFAQTDTDKSKSVTKAELEAFLVKGQG